MQQIVDSFFLNEVKKFTEEQPLDVPKKVSYSISLMSFQMNYLKKYSLSYFQAKPKSSGDEEVCLYRIKVL